MSRLSTLVENGEVGADVVVREKKGTVSGVEDMRRMGKEPPFKEGGLITQARRGSLWAWLAFCSAILVSYLSSALQ